MDRAGCHRCLSKGAIPSRACRTNCQGRLRIALLFQLGRLGIASFDECLSCLFILRNVFEAWIICYVSLSVSVRISPGSPFKSNPIQMWLVDRAWYGVGDGIAHGNFCADGVHHSGKIWIIPNPCHRGDVSGKVPSAILPCISRIAL